MLPTLLEALNTLAFTQNVSVPNEVLLARHMNLAWNIYQRDASAFEEYQRFQSRNAFGKCKYIVSFIGVPNVDEAEFVGIYEVRGVVRDGEQGFRAPEGDPQVIKETRGQRYLFDLIRLKSFDPYIGSWSVHWGYPASGKYQYLKPDLKIDVTRWDVRDVPTDSSIGLGEGGGFPEGTLAYVRHAVRERSAVLIAQVKSLARQRNEYLCAACGLVPELRYGSGIDCLECHHVYPVNEMKTGHRTRIEDIILLCANCHRAIHRKRPMPDRAHLNELIVHEQ